MFIINYRLNFSFCLLFSTEVKQSQSENPRTDADGY